MGFPKEAIIPFAIIIGGWVNSPPAELFRLMTQSQHRERIGAGKQFSKNDRLDFKIFRQ